MLKMVSNKELNFEVIYPKEKELNEFVCSHPQGNIFQTYEMAKVYENTRRLEPITLAAVDDSGNICASLVTYLSKEKEGILSPFATRAVIYGGPLFLGNEKGVKAVSSLMDHYDAVAGKKAIFTEIRMTHEVPELSLIKDKGYVYEDHLNFLLDLNPPVEKLRAQLSKSKKRYINKSLKKGCNVVEVSDMDSVSTAYSILSDTYNRVRLPLADESLFRSVARILVPKGMAKFFLARYDGMDIGTIVLLIFKDRGYDWYVGSRRGHSGLYPNDLLAWHAITSCKDHGCSTFDFCGAGKPNKEYGVREFKRGFGGELVNLGRYRKIHAPIKMQVAKLGFEVYRRIRR